jgi:hypothetical protein
MMRLMSIHEQRRRAPMHFAAKADNARFSAYLIATVSEEEVRRAAGQISYGGTPHIALGEAFRREASIALELIIKAVIPSVSKTARQAA